MSSILFKKLPRRDLKKVDDSHLCGMLLAIIPIVAVLLFHGFNGLNLVNFDW